MPKLLRLLPLCLALVSLACTLPLLAPANTPVPAPTPIPSGELVFQDPAVRQRFLDLEACLQAQTQAPEWVFTPYTPGGNFYAAGWCAGATSPDDCSLVPRAWGQPGLKVLRLYTLFYDLPEVFGLGMAALSAPEPGEWGLYFGYTEGGQSVMGEGFSLQFYQLDAAGALPQVKLTLELPYRYSVEGLQPDLTLVQPELPLSQELSRLAVSPEALQEAGLALLRRAALQGEKTLQTGTLSTCDYGEPPGGFPPAGGGLPPACTPRPFTQDEINQRLSGLQADFAGQQAVLQKHSTELYTLWMRMLPLDRCWK